MQNEGARHFLGKNREHRLKSRYILANFKNYTCKEESLKLKKAEYLKPTPFDLPFTLGNLYAYSLTHFSNLQRSRSLSMPLHVYPSYL